MHPRSQIVLCMLSMALVLVLGHRVESVSSAGAALYVTGKWLLLLSDAGLFNVSCCRGNDSDPGRK